MAMRFLGRADGDHDDGAAVIATTVDVRYLPAACRP